MPELPGKPLNREPDVDGLIQSFITYEDGYDRNHSLQPNIDGETHYVHVQGRVNNALKLSISQLKNDFAQHSVVCALQCAGNRRHTMRTKMKEVQGLDWFDGAVMNCKWTGPRLKDILERADIALDPVVQRTAHVAFACNATECQEDTWYGASIPLERALDVDKDVVLALEMNDSALTAAHGYPVRVITPGIAGARAVKWLDTITVQTTESDNHYMQFDYKVLPEEAVDADSAKQFWHRVPPVQEMPVNSVIAMPRSGEKIQRSTDGTVSARGYALPSGDGGPVTKVEVSGDGGLTWSAAEILHDKDEGRWSWALWKADVTVEPGKNRKIFSKATDASGNTQPDQSKWNLRGVCYNGFGDATELEIMEPPNAVS